MYWSQEYLAPRIPPLLFFLVPLIIIVLSEVDQFSYLNLMLAVSCFCYILHFENLPCDWLSKLNRTKMICFLGILFCFESFLFNITGIKSALVLFEFAFVWLIGFVIFDIVRFAVRVFRRKNLIDSEPVIPILLGLMFAIGAPFFVHLLVQLTFQAQLLINHEKYEAVVEQFRKELPDSQNIVTSMSDFTFYRVRIFAEKSDSGELRVVFTPSEYFTRMSHGIAYVQSMKGERLSLAAFSKNWYTF